jgi:hypothetical protein
MNGDSCQTVIRIIVDSSWIIEGKEAAAVSPLTFHVHDGFLTALWYDEQPTIIEMTETNND